MAVTADWTTTPDDTSVYLVGAVECTYRTAISEIPTVDKRDQGDTQRLLELIYSPTTIQQTVDFRLLLDHLTTGDAAWIDYERLGLAVEKDSTDKPIDLQLTRSALGSAPGVEQIPFRLRANKKILTHRFLAGELHWFQGEEEVKLYGLEAD